MAISAGPAGASNILSALYDVDFEPIVPLLVGEEGKLAKFLMELGGEEDLAARQVEWAYSEAIDSVDTIAATPANPTTVLTIQVTTIGKWKPNHSVLHAASGETLIIESVDSASSTVTFFERSRGDNVAASFASGDELVRMGTAQPDGSSIGEARMQQDVWASNKVQLFWENVDFDGTTVAINRKRGLRGGDFVARKRREKLLQVLRDIDYAHMFGESVESTDRRTMGGIVNFIASTETATIAALTELAFEQHLESKGLLHGPEKKLAITSAWVAGGLNRVASNKLQTTVGGKKYGYDLRTWQTPQGELKIMPHYNLSTVTALRGKIIMLDTANIHRAVLRPLKLYVDIDAGTRDATMDAWLGQMTAAWGHPRHHSYIKGITSFS